MVRVIADVRVLQTMRRARVVAIIAATIGFMAIGMAAYGFRSIDFIEWVMGVDAIFDSTEYRTAMTTLALFGIAALVAAHGLFRGKRWAKYLWLVLASFNILSAIPGIPDDAWSWAWLGISTAIFAISIPLFRPLRSRDVAAP